MLDLDGKPFCPTGSAQRYHRIGECECAKRDRSDPRLVWIAVGRLAMLPPSRLTFHRWHPRQWERTACGLPYEQRGRAGVERRQAMVAIRRDSAELIADPCRICWQHKSFMPEGE